MCVIIHKPAGVAFPEADIKLAYSNNPHGFGYVYYDPKKDTLICKKSVDYTEEQILKMFKAFIPYETVFHFRWRTLGNQTSKEAHPFRILKKENHGEDMFFCHNGTINAVDTKDKEESDTMAFNRVILKPLLRACPDLIEEDAFHELLVKYITSQSKLVFMYGKGRVIITNPSAGAQRAGCWVSNEYSFRPNYRTPVSNYNRGPVSQPSKPYSQPTVSVKFNDMMVKVGTEVLITTGADKSYHSEGVIEEVNNVSCLIKFTTLENKEEKLFFCNQDGTSFMRNGFYSAWAVDGEVLPENKKPDKNVVDIQDFKKASEKEETETEKKSQSSNQATAETPQETAKERATPDTKGASEEQVKSQTTQDGGQEPSSQDGTSSVDISNYIEPVSYNGITLDAKDRWMGMNVDSSNDYWGVTMRDVASLPPQKRFEFFMDNMEIAFMMWQDAIEFVVLEDDDFIADNLEDVEYYDKESIEAYEKVQKSEKK